ncbi:YaaC family protein [Aneurinibacillus uraniidurans]|uniref:YaaC family protein n=1 Tax=Aneurinibacillus uraniidurans TaxID=2966586 RepID=UPI00234A5DEE|nr:YaaC family protein [Aneurinibacillus sp. B1]WCN37858.1 YaaC family protein [Aneurinibacillus sp. B1]
MYTAVHTILCENPTEKMWDSYLYFENEPMVKQFLQNTYEKQDYKKANVLAFTNATKFIYYIKQARQYYLSAKKSDLLVRPLLLYYGMVSLLKAYILTRDPLYPSTTKVLQHGITSRKIKKNYYSLAEDEVRIQKEGLLPYFHSLLQKEPVCDKYQLSDLLALLPELQPTYQRIYHKTTLLPVTVSPSLDVSRSCTVLSLSEEVLDCAHLTYDSFIYYMNRYNKGEGNFSASNANTPSGMIQLEWSHPTYTHVKENGNGFENELFSSNYKGEFFYNVSIKKDATINEIEIHYMIMYIISMLCRYETEKWGEIIFSFASEDLYIIQEFLTISTRKFPNIMYDLLLGKRHIFQVV